MFSRISMAAATLAFTIIIALSGSPALAAGALAIDSNQGGSYGWAIDYPSSGQAEQRALQECGGGCQIVLNFDSGCGAYAADQAYGSTAVGWATSSSGSDAQSTAMSECQSRGGTSCMIRAWGCN